MSFDSNDNKDLALGSCIIKDVIQIICPKCDQLISLPMHQAVNGENIICPFCNFEFKFCKEA